MEKSSARRVRKNNTMKVVLVVMLGLILVVFGVVAFLQTHKVTRISDNIYVNSISVGGLTVEEATELLNKEVTDAYFDKTVAISYGDESFDADLLGVVTINAEKTAENALEKSNSLWERLFDKSKVVLPFELDIEADEITVELLNFARNNKIEDGVFTFDDEYSTVDIDASKIDTIMSVEKTLDLIFDNAENDIFENVGAVLIDNNDKVFAEELYRRLVRPAKNATVGMNDDGSTYIIPEEFGIKADKDTFMDLYSKNGGVFTMDIESVKPEILTGDLDIEFYQDVLGSYTSAYNMGLVNRTKNVSIAARLVNGTVIMPGKRFSYNSVVGPRTYERGFVDATVYTGEGTEEGIGGGICQVSSTIYCAQLRANLKTISRTNHSYTIVYVPLGQDATVVYGSLDYVFENDTNYPVKILASASGGYLNVKIMGTKIDKGSTVDIVSVVNSTIGYGEVTQETADLPVGTTEVKQNGQNGAVVSTYKVYYKDGVEQSREFIGKSNYKPLNKIILVGTEVSQTENIDSDENTEIVDGKPTEPTENTENTGNTENVEDTETEIPEETVEVTEIPISENGL